ncbi:MAG: 4-hydroxy-tetrahydrodipicolinate reductase [Chlamydiae bacterium]|nr:MAG: 4-hydroxy-tetrahydrodipicolinate reductase [Chlamydiota bacterium]
MNICICGAAGRMGKRLIACAAEMENMKVIGAVDIPQCPLIDQDSGIVSGIEPNGTLITADLKSACENADAVIDFALADGIISRLAIYETMNIAAVFGTTAVNEPGRTAIEAASKKIPVIHAPNFSVGVNLLFALAKKSAKILDENYDIEIVEMHHHHKKDAPSGTAVKLAELVEEGRGLKKNEKRIYGRKGNTGARPKGEIAVHSLRGGDVVGDHTVVFAADGERIELTHKASSRNTFAKGALRATKFLVGKKPGIYTMEDMLGM